MVFTVVWNVDLIVVALLVAALAGCDSGGVHRREAGVVGLDGGEASADAGQDAAERDSRSDSSTGPLDAFFALDSSAKAALFQNERSRLVIGGCNHVSYDQFPGSPYRFAGRRHDGCADTTWDISLTVLDTNTSTLGTAGTLLSTSPAVAVPNDARKVSTAYDPTVAAFGGRMWVAFECHGTGFAKLAGACAAPLNASGSALDTSKLSVLVDGTDEGKTPNKVHSASVPKLLTHNGKLFLFWTMVTARVESGKTPWERISTRGAELEIANGGLLRVKGASGPVRANGNRSVQVWGPGTGSRDNSVADVFDFVSEGDYVYAIAGVGGGGCLKPTDAVTGCYRIAIRRARSPLARDAFTNASAPDRVPDAALPANPVEYARYYSLPDGQAYLYGAFFKMHEDDGGVLHDGDKLELPSSGGNRLYQFRLPLAGALCDASTQKPPHFGMREGVCRKSCGGLGGTSSYFRACEREGKSVAGIAYDVPYCCR